MSRLYSSVKGRGTVSIGTDLLLHGWHPITMKYKKLIIRALISVGAVFGVIVGVFYLTVYMIVKDDINNKEDFQSNVWKNDPEKRPYMLRDLGEEYLKKGMSKDEVIKLLGEPDGHFYDAAGYKYGDNAIGYSLDYRDPWDFTVYFDANQRVVSWQENSF